MPQLNFTVQGAGPTVVLSHALGADLGQWDEVTELLAQRFRVLRYDHRGHGRSERVAGPVSLEDLAEDAAALIERECGGAVHFVGLSLGGMVAQLLAARHPGRIASIVVANSSSRFDDTGRGMWRARIETVRNLGMPGIAQGVLARWFTPAFHADPANAGRIAHLREGLLANDPAAYAATAEAVARIDFGTSNPLIACPALVIAGATDEVTPPAMSETIRDQISGAQLATLEAAHMSAIERPAEFASLVARFIGSL
jgi:3-oxoadipate enol-lactonase